MKHLIKFQKQHGLNPDGILGKITMCKFLEVFNLPGKEATAHFLGQLAHETNYFRYAQENLKYSAKGLLKTFPNHFNLEQAHQYAKKPVDIANRVYADRMGNGSEHSGEGWLYRGRGAIMLTGKDNYKLFGDQINKDLVCYPNLVKSDYYFEVAKWFFDQNKLWRYCDHVDPQSISNLTRKINGGFNGLDHRYNLTINFYNLIK